MRSVDELTMYAYRLLGEAEEASMKAHVESCASCAETIERIESESRLFEGALAREEEDPLERGRVLDAVLARRSPAAVPAARPRMGLVRILQALTAAAAALAIGLFVAGRREIPPAPPESPAPPAPGREVLAFVRDAGIGSLAARDEVGRPVGELGLKSHHVAVEISDGVAKTTVEENFENHTDRRLEGTFRFPLPPDASISRLALEVNGKIEEGTCLERERARQVFESIVSRMKDPALLEWMPGGIFQCRIFPIEPRATKRVIVAYTQALPSFRGRMTYVYPLASEKTSAHPPGDLRIEVEAKVSGVLSRFESSSHRADVQRRGASEARLTFAVSNLRPRNDFVVAIDTMDDEVRVVPHKVDGDDGYFALFLSPRGEPARRPGRYVLVLDVSASVTGPELDVARRLVRAFMERGIAGDRFEILAHHVEVLRGGELDLRTANDFMDGLRPVGGSDVLGALLAAPEGEIVYIGKGRPSFGETDPARILEALRGRRIRTIGVGSRANVELLQKLGGHLQVSPSDDVPRRVAEIAATLGCPVLSGIEVSGGDAVYDVTGVRDVFYGERLLVAGRYRGPAAKLVVTGRDYRREVDVDFPAKEEGNNYVRRLWAQRRIADLLARGDVTKAEVTDLGVRHQIMTPYTSFLVLENEQMWKDHQLKREVQKQDQVMAGPARPWIGAQGMELAVRAQVMRIQAAPEADRPSELEALSRFVDEFRHPSLDADYREVRRMIAEAGGESRNRGTVSPEKVARALERLRASLDDVGVDIVNRANEALPGIDGRETRPGEPAARETVTSLPFGLGRETGPGRQLQETLRMREEAERLEMERRGSGQTQNGPMPDFLAPSQKARQAILGADGVVRYAEVRTTTNQFGGIDFALGEASRAWTSPESGTVEAPVLRDLPILGYLFDPRGPAPVPQEPAPGAVPGFSRFSLVANGAAQSIDLPRIIPPETRVLPLKYLQPPVAYTAQVQADKFISGRPFQPPAEVEESLRRFELLQLVRSVLSKDAEGRVVGAVNFDPATNCLVIRDTQAVIDRVSQIVAALDVEPDQVLLDLKVIRTTNQDLLDLGVHGHLGVGTAPSLSPTALAPGGAGDARLPFAPGGGSSPFYSEQDMTMILRAFKNDPRSRLIYEPTLAVSDKMEASVFLGEMIGTDGTVTTPFRLVLIPKVVPDAAKVILTVVPQGDQPSGRSGAAAVGEPVLPAPRAIENGPDQSIDLPRLSSTGTVARLIIESGRTAVLRAAPLSPEEGQLLIFITPRIVRAGNSPRPALREQGASPPTVLSVNETRNEIVLEVDSGVGAMPGQLFAVMRGSTFVAILQVREAAGDRVRAGVWRGPAMGRVLPGDRAERIRDLREFLSGLPEETRLDLSSRAGLAAIREKMRLKD